MTAALAVRSPPVALYMQSCRGKPSSSWTIQGWAVAACDDCLGCSAALTKVDRWTAPAIAGSSAQGGPRRHGQGSYTVSWSSKENALPGMHPAAFADSCSCLGLLLKRGCCWPQKHKEQEEERKKVRFVMVRY